MIHHGVIYLQMIIYKYKKNKNKIIYNNIYYNKVKLLKIFNKEDKDII